MERATIFGTAAILLSLMTLFNFWFVPGFIPSAGGPDSSVPQNCSAGFYVKSVGESNGTLVIVCSQIGWTQLTGFPSGCSAGQFVIAVNATLTCATPGGSDSATTTKCTSGQFANNVTESGAGVMTIICSLVNWSSLQSFPAGCSAGNFVTAVGATLTCTSSSQETSSTAQCTSGQFVYNVTEASSGITTISCSLINWSSLQGFPAGCPANQFVTAVGSSLTCSAPNQELASTSQCTSGQFVYNVTETTAGAITVQCSLINWSSLQNFPTGCTAGNFVTNIGTVLTCSAPNQEQASTKQCTNSGYHVYNVTEASSGVITIVCAQQTWGSIISFPAGCNAGSFVTAVNTTLTCVSVSQETASTQQCTNNTYHVYNVTESSAGAFTILCAQQTWASLQSFPSACSSGQYVSGVGVTLTCSAVGWTQLTGFPSACAAGQFVSTIASTPTCTNPNLTFQSNNKNCTDVTATTKKMAGFKLNYTTVGTGKVYVTINFQITAGTAALVNTKYQPAYGTGSAPACNAAVTGTVVGNQYEVSPASSTAAAIWSESVTIGITTLSASTTYWFDIQISDSTTGSWIYGLPQMTVTES